MNGLKQRYNRWKSRRDFIAKHSLLSEGMSADAIRESLGEPDEVTSRQEGAKLYYEWRYSNINGNGWDYVLLIDGDSNLMSSVHNRIIYVAIGAFQPEEKQLTYDLIRSWDDKLRLGVDPAEAVSSFPPDVRPLATLIGQDIRLFEQAVGAECGAEPGFGASAEPSGITAENSLYIMNRGNQMFTASAAEDKLAGRICENLEKLLQALGASRTFSSNWD